MSAKGLGSDASRQISRVDHVRAPPSDIYHDDISNTTGPARKRKHDAYEMGDLLKAPIVVKPYPPKITTKPRSLQPLMLLPREHLSLSCLDLAAPSGDFEYARQYESNVKILDLESRMGNRPAVLVARMESNKTVYAMERQDGNLYTLCRLGNWVDLAKLSMYATVAYSKLLKPRLVLTDPMCLEASTTPQLHNDNKKRRLAMEAIQSLVKRPARSQSISLPSQTLAATSSTATVGDGGSGDGDEHGVHAENAVAKSNVIPAPDQTVAPHTAEAIFENIRSQYFEALYHSMGSLAYYAKGPLSRARAAFHLDCDSNLDMNELVDFLKSHILTTVQIDKKYRDSVPDVIAKMKTHIADSGGEQEAKTRKRKTKKPKLGKDGLYPNEDEHVREWWDARKPHLKDDQSTSAGGPQENRLQVSCLRSRETQLQMILILEILALEPLASTTSATDSQLPGLPAPAKATTPETSKEPSPKKRNKHNLPVLLDVHADRLSIWQSISLDEMKMMDDSQASGSNTAQTSIRSVSDPLKDFCVDIVVPFFSSRLPEKCDLLNRKLGGPVMPSPPEPKPQAKKSESAIKPKARPGALTSRPSTSKPSRTLDRVLSKETERNRRSISRGPGSMIALMRSATTPIPTLKREASDAVSLTSLPSRDVKDANASHHRSSSTVSESTKHTIQGDKARKHAEIKAELQAAISGLRKPNREVVVGNAMAEADERRASTSLSQLKKSRKPTEHPGIHNVVKATPAGPRFRNALAKEAYSQPAMGSIYESVEASNVVSSSALRILSTAPRKRNSEMAFAAKETSPALPLFGQPSGMVNATPARPVLTRNFLSAPASDEGLILASSPVATRKFLALPSGSLKNRDSGVGMPSSPGGCLAETPVKRPRLAARGSLEGFITVTPAKRRVVDNFISTPAQPKLVHEKQSAKKLSIFEKLGWDDDYDELLEL